MTALLATAGGVSAAVLFEGFNSGLPTSGNQASPGLTIPLSSGNWFAINESTPIGTGGVSEAADGAPGGIPGGFLPHEGSRYARFDYLSGAPSITGATISTWLMSPSVVFNNGDTISFYTRTDDPVDFPDRLRLRLSTNGSSTATSDFSTVMVTINPALNFVDYPLAWTQFTATVAGLSGPTAGRIAFHYDVIDGGPSGANSWMIGVDAVSMDLSSLNIPEPSAVMLAAGLGFLAAVRRRR